MMYIKSTRTVGSVSVKVDASKIAGGASLPEVTLEGRVYNMSRQKWRELNEAVSAAFDEVEKASGIV